MRLDDFSLCAFFMGWKDEKKCYTIYRYIIYEMVSGKNIAEVWKTVVKRISSLQTKAEAGWLYFHDGINRQRLYKFLQVCFFTGVKITMDIING